MLLNSKMIQFLPYVLKGRRILKVEGHDGNVPLVRIVGIVHPVRGGEYRAIPLLYHEWPGDQ